MDRIVTAFFAVTAVAFVTLGVLSIITGQYLFGALFLLLGGGDVWTIRRRRKKPARPVHSQDQQAVPQIPRRSPVAVPDEASIRALPEPVTACPECGYLGIRSAGARGGAYAGGGVLLSACRCPHCGYEGLPIRFEHRTDYGQFIRELHTLREQDAGSAPER